MKFKHTFHKAAIAGLLASGVAGSAWASTDCELVMQSWNMYPEFRQSLEANHPECFGSQNTVSTTTINATTFQQALQISRIVSSRIRPTGPAAFAAAESPSGLAAGGATDRWNIWASRATSDTSVSDGRGARTDSTTGNTIVGGDFALSPATHVGVSLALDRSHISTLAGANSNSGGYVVAPYFGYQIGKEWVADLSFGYGNGTYGSAANTTDIQRLFYSGNLSYETWKRDWQYAAKVTYLHGEDRYGDSSTNGTPNPGSTFRNKIDQVRFGAQVGYWMNGVMPYAALAYSTDIRRTSTLAGVDPLGRKAFVVTLGANFMSLANKITGGISYETEQGRRNSRGDTWMANLNVRF